MKTLIQKLTSRKFIAAVAGIVTGVGVIASGNTTEGVIAVIASVIAYLVAEGYIDAKAVDIADSVIEETKDKMEGDAHD